MFDDICNNCKHFKCKDDVYGDCEVYNTIVHVRGKCCSSFHFNDNIVTVCADNTNPLYDVYVKNVKGDIENYIAKGSNMKFYHGIVRVEDENGKVVICDVTRFTAYSQE